jgi:hypothetical protein
VSPEVIFGGKGDSANIFDSLKAAHGKARLLETPAIKGTLRGELNVCRRRFNCNSAGLGNFRDRRSSTINILVDLPEKSIGFLCVALLSRGGT